MSVTIYQMICKCQVTLVQKRLGGVAETETPFTLLQDTEPSKCFYRLLF